MQIDLANTLVHNVYFLLFYLFTLSRRIPYASAKLGNFVVNHIYWLCKSIFLSGSVVEFLYNFPDVPT